MNDEGHPPGDVDPETGWGCFRWKGQLTYRCPQTWEGGARCKFSTYSKDDMAAHVREAHASARAVRRPHPPLYGPNDQPISHDEEVPLEFRNVRFKEGR